MKKQVTPGETPEKITVSMIDQDLKDGISKAEMAVKYNIKPWEVDEMFKHPFLKGRRPSRKKALSFTFVDDTLPLNSGDIAVEQAAEAEEEFVDPNQVTLEDAIDDAIESATKANEALTEAVEVVEEIFPTQWKAKDSETGEDIELDQDAQDALNEALDTHINNDGQTLREAFDQESSQEEEIDDEEEDGTFEL